MNTYLIISSLLNFSVALVIALTAFVTARRNIGSLSFGAVALSVGMWSGAYCLWRLVDSPDIALMLCRVLLVGAIFVPVTLLHFALALTGRTGRWLRISGYLFATALAAIDFTPAMVASVGSAGGLDLWPRAGPLFSVFLVYFFGCIGAAVVLLLSAKAGLGATRGHRRFIVFALTIGVVGGSTNFPLWYGIPIPPVGNGLVFIYLGMLGYAVMKHRLPHVQTDFVKGAAYFGISTLVGVACVLISIFVGVISHDIAPATELTARFFFGMVISAFALWAVPVSVEMAERFLEQSLLKERSRVQRGLKTLLRVIGAEQEESAIFRAAAQRLADIFHANDVAIFFRGEMEPAMRLRAGLPGLHCPSELLDDYPLLRALATRPSSLSTGRLTLAAARSASDQSEALRKLGFELAVPMVAEGRLMGILLLDRPAATRDDSEAVISLIEAVCLQVALTIIARRLERRANEADKLIAIGTLAAGLAHELRNPLTSIHTFVSLVESGINPGEDAEFVRIVARDSQRISSIVENVSLFATSTDRAMGPVDLEHVLVSTLEIANRESVGTRVQTTQRCTVRAPIRGNFGQLQQVFLNLVQNAIQAIGSGDGAVELVAEPIVLADGQAGARVIVRDSGPGVAPEVLPRMFEPFVTTKATGERTGKRGLGLGLAIVKRIIEAHHGDVRVETIAGRGTAFFVYLPGYTEN